MGLDILEGIWKPVTSSDDRTTARERIVDDTGKATIVPQSFSREILNLRRKRYEVLEQGAYHIPSNDIVTLTFMTDDFEFKKEFGSMLRLRFRIQNTDSDSD